MLSFRLKKKTSKNVGDTTYKRQKIINLNVVSERIVQLERNAVNNVQYHRCESLEINPVSVSTDDDVLESSVCRALSLNDHEAKPADLQACHHLKKKDTVIIKSKY